jgi:hypothetical protein
MTLTIGKLKNISAVLLEKPENNALDRQVTKLEAVAILKVEIGEMLKKGYDLEDIAKVLKENDFDIQMPTLKSYFNKVREKQAKKPRAPKAASQPDKNGEGS